MFVFLKKLFYKEKSLASYDTNITVINTNNKVIRLREEIQIPFFERIYDYLLRTIFGIANPLKKSIINTKCEVHKHINQEALTILYNDKYLNEYFFLKNNIAIINHGAVWADQDFKSSNHFYNPYKKIGLYGRKNAMNLCAEYYNKALKNWKNENLSKSFFYLGAALHLTQDMTIPQHANIKLLDNHRQYETYVKKTYRYADEFKAKSGAYLLDDFTDYIRFNARIAIKIYNKFKYIREDECRFLRTASCALPLAKRTTAGAMILFVRDINNY